jgi:hypothetical protein
MDSRPLTVHTQWGLLVFLKMGILKKMRLISIEWVVTGQCGCGLWAGRLGFDYRQGQRYFFSPSSLVSSGTGGIKRPGREADHSPPSSAEIKNTWSYISTPHTSLWRWVLRYYKGICENRTSGWFRNTKPIHLHKGLVQPHSSLSTCRPHGLKWGQFVDTPW